jgi:hypothetical protein
MMGGDVTVASEPGKGSVFTVRLPTGAENLGVAAVSVPAAINAASVSGLIVVTVGVRSGTGRGCCNPAVAPLAMVARTESAPSSLTRPHASAALNKPFCTSDSDNAPPLTSWVQGKDAR